jgi:serine/threonine-protein kinase
MEKDGRQIEYLTRLGERRASHLLIVALAIIFPTMTGPNSFWTRVKNARIVQVLVAYLAVSWGILQVTDIFQQSLELPQWVLPVALLLLVIGFVIIAATAWVQSHPATAERAARDEVPEAWELQPGEITEALAKGRLPHLTWARALLGGGVAFLLLFGFAGLYIVVKDQGRSLAPTEAIASSEALPGIAVLPFSVTGGELSEWREGMVDLLSTNLDGAAGLRAINSRTVMARWDELAGDDDRVDEATSLRVAEATQARYALLGSAVGIGPSVRLTADVYDVASGDRLRQARVEGSPDSVLALVDQLSIEVIGAIMSSGEGELPSVNLAGITTTSVPALKAYLEGEAAFRHADFDAAIEALGRAVETDSTFALAYYRLANSYGWKETTNHPLTQENRARALQLVDRLPERQALLVRIENARGDPESLDLALDAVARYPDDPEAWYLLGELYLHSRYGNPTWEQTDQAFSRAVELDPSFAPYRIHLIDLAFAVYDSALIADRLEDFEALAPGATQQLTRSRVGIALAHGDSAGRAWAGAVLDTLDAQEIRVALGTVQAVDARAWQVEEELVQALERRGEAGAFQLGRGVMISMRHGALAEWVERVQDPRLGPSWRNCTLNFAFSSGVPVDEDLIESAMAVSAFDSTAEFANMCAAWYAADRERWDDHEQFIAWIQRKADRVRAAGDSSYAQALNGMAGFARGYGQVRRGQFEGLTLAAYADDTWYDFAVVLGDLYAEADSLEVAVRHYRTDWIDPLVRLRLARVYERMGEKEKARDAYLYFVESWVDADPELQPMVEEAKRAIVKLRADF